MSQEPHQILKVKIAFAKQERELKMAKVLQEQKLEEFELLRELELNKAKLNVCEETERTQTPSLDEDLDTLPCESEGEGLERFFKGLPTPTGAGAACTLARAQVTQASAVTTTATPLPATSNLRISAPVFSPGISTQPVSSPHHSDHKKVCLSTPKWYPVLKLFYQQLVVLFKLPLR